MIAIAKRKRVLRFEVSTTERGRALIVEATPYNAILREKGRRHRYAVPWGAVYWLAVKAEADEARKKTHK